MVGAYEATVEERLRGAGGLEDHGSGYHQQGQVGNLCRWGQPRDKNSNPETVGGTGVSIHVYEHNNFHESCT